MTTRITLWALGLTLAALANSARGGDEAEKTAIEAIKKAGGSVSIADHLPGKTTNNVFFDGSKSKMTDDFLKEMVPHLARIKNLRSLSIDFADASFSETGLKEIVQLKNLTHLNLRYVPVTDAGLKELASLPQLQSLHLPFTTRNQITDVGLKELARCKHLKGLDLGAAKVTDAGLSALAGMKLGSLTVPFEVRTDLGLKHYLAAVESTSLYLYGWKFSEAGLRELAKRTHLKVLFLDYSSVTDKDLGFLTGLDQLSLLSLERTKITDAGLKHLAGLRNLKELRLDYTKIGDDGLKELAKLQNLVILRLKHSQVSNEGLKHLTPLRGLEYLEVASPWVSAEGRKHLTELPRLKSVSIYKASPEPK